MVRRASTDSDRLMRARLGLALGIGHGRDGGGIPPMISSICDSFEDIAILEESGHLVRSDVWADWNRTIEFWWPILAPKVHQRRLLYPGDFEGFERLNALMRKLDRAAGQVNEFDPVTISPILDDLIVNLTASLRLEQESRAGVIPTAPEWSASA